MSIHCNYIPFATKRPAHTGYGVNGRGAFSLVYLWRRFAVVLSSRNIPDCTVVHFKLLKTGKVFNTVNRSDGLGLRRYGQLCDLPAVIFRDLRILLKTELQPYIFGDSRIHFAVGGLRVVDGLRCRKLVFGRLTDISSR